MHNQQAFLAALIVAGGSGTRLGGSLPKQFLPLAGKPVLLWSIEALLHCDEVRCVVVAVPEAYVAQAREMMPGDSRVRVVTGGDSRTASVRAGLDAMADLRPSAVLIHDAARPGLTPAVVRELAKALETADAAAPALPMTDAVKETGDTLRSVARDRLVRIQTPQAFRYDLIRDAIAGAGDAAVDDLALIEGSGATVTLTPGRQELMKITHPEDLAIAERLLAPSAAPVLRVGTGFDVHGFEPGDHVTICGVRVPHTKKLQGHSDADVGWHALTDAILGAAALGDIGQHFPPSDPKWRGADSLVFLKHAVTLAAAKGFRVVNADITLICERPKIGPHREAMVARTAEALGIDPGAVSVKATTTEKLGFTGREEGIAGQAVVMLAG